MSAVICNVSLEHAIFFVWRRITKKHILFYRVWTIQKGVQCASLQTILPWLNKWQIIFTIHYFYIKLQNISSCRLTSNNYAARILLHMKSLHFYNTICVCLHGMYTGGNMFRIYPFPIIDREMKRITFLAIWKVVWSISSYHSIL